MTETERTATVLVVDDEPLNRTLLRERLRPEGYQVLEASSGQEALDTLEREPVDLLLLDVRMPGMDGLEVCRRVRAAPRQGYLPVVLLTALSGQSDRHEGLAAGADEFLSKPIDARELLLRARALIRLRQQDRTIRAQIAHAREQEAVIRSQLEELRHLAELKDDLFALVVHDLRNPLTGLAGYIELLREELARSGAERAQQLAERAHASAARLRTMLEELLEVQRLEQRELPLELRRVSMSELANDAARTIEGAAAQRQVALEVVADERLEAELDPRLTRRALENLLGNALKFAPPRSRVGVVARAEEGMATLRVEDQGPGVAATVKARLFRKFGALEAEAGPRRGFGLGLHLVRLVAEAHGGRAFVDDRPGGGAVFGLSVPLSQPRRDA